VLADECGGVLTEFFRGKRLARPDRTGVPEDHE
jgi:hypothetical protein